MDAGLNFGVCPCGGEYETRSAPIAKLGLEDVPHGECRVCKSRVYKAALLERLEAVMKGDAVDPRLAKPTL